MLKSSLPLFLILFIALLCIYLFWLQPFLLVALLLILSWYKHTKYPIKHELNFYVAIVILGSLVEIFYVNTIPAWSYEIKHFFNIPLYVPFQWALIGVSIISIYERQTKKS
ncbi:MAG: hypothetical protein AAB553_00645 [Patescibacteria group bacterium]